MTDIQKQLAEALEQLVAAQKCINELPMFCDRYPAQAAQFKLLDAMKAAQDALAAHRASQDASRQQEASKPHGWIVMWPAMGGGHKPVYTHGPDKPGYGPELDALLTVYPVYAAAHGIKGE